MDSYGEETPLFLYNGNSNPSFISYPSGLVGQSPLLHPNNDPSADDYFAPLERRVLPPAPHLPPQADQPQPPPLKKRKTKRDAPPSSAAIPSTAPPPAPGPVLAPAMLPVPAPAPAPLPAAAPAKFSSAVTSQQMADLRSYYHISYHDLDRATRAAERERVAALVGVTPRHVTVKYGEFHRQAKRAKAKANANDDDDDEEEEGD